jgi:protein-tyrosine phosphatase
VEDIDQLATKLGVTAVLNLQSSEDFDELGCDWLSLHKHYRRLKIVVRRVPVRDFDEDDLCRQLPDCVQALNELLHKGHTVYLHCTAGLGRSASVLVTYLHWVQQLDLEKAVRVVQNCRPCSPNLDAIHRASEELLGDCAA